MSFVSLPSIVFNGLESLEKELWGNTSFDRMSANSCQSKMLLLLSLETAGGYMNKCLSAVRIITCFCCSGSHLCDLSGLTHNVRMADSKRCRYPLWPCFDRARSTHTVLSWAVTKHHWGFAGVVRVFFHSTAWWQLLPCHHSQHHIRPLKYGANDERVWNK